MKLYLYLTFIFCIAITATVSTSLVLLDDWPWWQENDFAHYYISSKLFLNGTDPYSKLLTDQYDYYKFAPKQTINFATNPPALISLFAPIALLPTKTAFLTWNILQLLLLIILIIYSIKLCKLENIKAIDYLLMSIAVFISLPVTAHIRFSQGQILITSIIICGLSLLLTKQNLKMKFGAICWGLAVAIKIFPFPLVIPLVYYFGFKMVFWFGVGILIAHVPFLVQLGVSPIFVYIFEILPKIEAGILNFRANVGFSAVILSILKNIFQYDSFSLEFIKFATRASYIILVPIVILILRNQAVKNSPLLGTLLILPLVVTFSPTAWTHYLVLTIPTFILVLKLAMDHKSKETAIMTLIIFYLFIATNTGLSVKSDLLKIVWLLVTSFGLISLALVLLRNNGADNR